MADSRASGGYGSGGRVKAMAVSSGGWASTRRCAPGTVGPPAPGGIYPHHPGRQPRPSRRRRPPRAQEVLVHAPPQRPPVAAEQPAGLLVVVAGQAVDQREVAAAQLLEAQPAVGHVVGQRPPRVLGRGGGERMILL